MKYYNKLARLYLVVIIGSILLSCRSSRSAGDKTGLRELHFIGEYIIPHNAQFKNTTIGGLSGIDYDAENKLFYIISDDWSMTNAARFYTARILINEKGIDTVEFVDVVAFLQRDGTVYPGAKENPYRTPDPEAIRYNPLNSTLIWTTEGERFIMGDSLVLQDPAIRIITKEGKQLDSLPLPPQAHMYKEEKGLRRNGAFEGLSFADNYNNLYVSIEEPIYEDGPRAAMGDTTAWIRLFKYDVRSKQLTGEYAYQVDPVVRAPVPSNGFKINGVSDIMEINKNKLLFVERSYSFSVERTDCNVRVYSGDVSRASDITMVNSLMKKKFNPVKKQLVLNMDSLGLYIGNIEGVCFGPQLPNGHKTLIFIADNNFRATEKTQFLLFEIIE